MFSVDGNDTHIPNGGVWSAMHRMIKASLEKESAEVSLRRFFTEIIDALKISLYHETEVVAFGMTIHVVCACRMCGTICGPIRL